MMHCPLEQPSVFQLPSFYSFHENILQTWWLQVMNSIFCPATHHKPQLQTSIEKPHNGLHELTYATEPRAVLRQVPSSVPSKRRSNFHSGILKDDILLKKKETKQLQQSQRHWRTRWRSLRLALLGPKVKKKRRRREKEKVSWGDWCCGKAAKPLGRSRSRSLAGQFPVVRRQGVHPSTTGNCVALCGQLHRCDGHRGLPELTLSSATTQQHGRPPICAMQRTLPQQLSYTNTQQMQHCIPRQVQVRHFRCNAKR